MAKLYVSPLGNDKAEGTLEAPFRTPERAAARVTELAREDWDGEAVVYLRGGAYPLAAPWTLTGDAPVTFRSYPGEKAVLSGGEPVENLRETEQNGVRAWVADLPEVRAGKRYFRSLYVNGACRPRASLPKQGYYWMERVPGITLQAGFQDGGDRFIAAEGDMRAFDNLSDAFIHVFHYWVDEHMPVASFDPNTREVVCANRSRMALKDDNVPRYAKYRVENVAEGLTEPGEWYLDRARGTLTYLPLPGETLENTSLVAPRIEQLLLLRDASDVRFEGVEFRHTDWRVWQSEPAKFDAEGKRIPLASYGQGAPNVRGACELENVKRCAFVNCVFEGLGGYAIDMLEGCSAVRVERCAMRELGGGGVKISGADAFGPREKRDEYIRVTDCEICAGGRVFLSAIGVIARHANHIVVAHNHIHDLYYSGVSLGWVWGYKESASFDNLVEYNHIHDLGHGVLSDMGGVYTLGVQPGTVIRHNLIHDIEKSNYGGWAIYPDEGSSHILIENNVCYNTSSSVFHQHYGRENVVRNNVWAFGREGEIAYSRQEDHIGFTFEHNIVFTKGQPIHVGGYSNKIMQGNIKSDLNVYWDVDGGEIAHADQFNKPETYVSLEQAKTIGLDLHSVAADPLCKNPARGDFALSPDSPAIALGFVPIDMTGIGVRE